MKFCCPTKARHVSIARAEPEIVATFNLGRAKQRVLMSLTITILKGMRKFSTKVFYQRSRHILFDGEENFYVVSWFVYVLKKNGSYEATKCFFS